VHAVRTEGRPGGWSQPHVPIQSRRHFHRRWVAGSARTGRQTDVDRVDFADPSVAHQFGDAQVLRHRTVLGRCLVHGPVALDRFAQHAALGDRQRGFLADHVLARLDRHHRHGHMPVVRRRDHYGIHVAAVDHLAEVLGDLAMELVPHPVFHVLHGAVQVALVHLAQRHDLRIPVSHKSMHVGHALSTQADAADGDPFRGRHGLAQADCASGNDRRRPDNCRRFQEIPPRPDLLA